MATQHPMVRIQTAAMPHPLAVIDDGPLPTDPKINVLYVAPGHDIIRPAQVEAAKLEIVAIGAGTELSRISPTMIVKYGSHASLIEAKTMLFIAQHTSLPVPKLYAAYTYGPLDRNVGDFGSLYDTYIFMEFIPGETLEKAWGTYDSITKSQIASELRGYMEHLRSIPAANYIGSVDRGPVTDMILEWTSPTQGPFDSQEAFNTAIAEAFVSKSKGHVGPFIHGMMNSHKHTIVFSHGDLRPPNIIVRDGHVAAIQDWELGGWYPEYWEFAKAFQVEHFITDWPTYILDILKPHYGEQAMHSYLTTVLW